jgi:hypothetical protein
MQCVNAVRIPRCLRLAAVEIPILLFDPTLITLETGSKTSEPGINTTRSTITESPVMQVSAPTSSPIKPLAACGHSSLMTNRLPQIPPPASHSVCCLRLDSINHRGSKCTRISKIGWGQCFGFRIELNHVQARCSPVIFHPSVDGLD